MKNIEWANTTWNPVWGCLNNCPYCYARTFANRFAEQVAMKGLYESSIIPFLKAFKPTWLESNFKKTFPKRPSRIFVNSMSDIRFWNVTWMDRVLAEIEMNPYHHFLFLTKFPEVYSEYFFPENCWLGVSCPGKPTEAMIRWALLCKNKHFVSIEPLMDDPYTAWLACVDWVIVGGLTPRPAHENGWVNRIVLTCQEEKIPVFLKDNLHYTGCSYHEFPEGMA